MGPPNPKKKGQKQKYATYLLKNKLKKQAQRRKEKQAKLAHKRRLETAQA